MKDLQKRKLRIVVLMEYASENGMEYIKELRRLGVKIYCVIVIGHEYSKKREDVLAKRTSGKYIRDNFSDLMNISKVPIYMVNNINGESCFHLIKGMDSDIIVFEG